MILSFTGRGECQVNVTNNVLPEWLSGKLDSGKGLGGSSSINFYVFTHPPASDIDGMLYVGFSVRSSVSKS